jgi:gamma-glutamylcyclotransferase (GGCT)/AIG2-like uncharacterized protein YtfP
MNVFVYGTLLVPKIWETVTRTKGLVSQSASLSGFEIRCVRDAVYPGIHAAPAANEPVPGRVFFDVPEPALRRLDAYEDDFYLRAEVFPEIDGGARVKAHAYLVPTEKADTILSPHGWSLEWFELNCLEEFWKRFFTT